MARLVNIPRDIVDTYYRYKMPVLKAKVEGKGNGIKTVVENMEDIAKALGRPATYPTKFFGFELGALTKIDGNHKHIVNGKHDAEALAVVLDNFIARYVLCFQCRNPETVLNVRGETITSQCKACGKVNQIDMTHKLSTYILRNPPEKSVPQETRAPEKRAPEVSKSSKVEVEDEIEWSVDISPAAVEARRRELLGTRDRLTQRDDEDETSEAAPAREEVPLVFEPGKNPVPALQQYLAAHPPSQAVVQAVQEAAAKVRFSDTQTMKVIFMAIFDAELKTNFYKKCDSLALFVKGSKHEKVVLYCIEKLVEKETKLLPDLRHILHGFYEEAILTQDTIFKWHEHVSKTADDKKTDPKERKFAQQLKENSSAFVEWLDKAESDDEDDYL